MGMALFLVHLKQDCSPAETVGIVMLGALVGFTAAALAISTELDTCNKTQPPPRPKKKLSSDKKSQEAYAAPDKDD